MSRMIGIPARTKAGTALILSAIWLAISAASIDFANAQSYARTAKVETQSATQQRVAPQTRIQGRVKTGIMEIVTAPAAGTVRLTEVRIGDIVIQGQKLAEQDSTKLRYQQRLLELQKQETETRIRQLTADIELEEQLGGVAEEKLTLLAARLARAEKLRASQTISSEAFDTTKSAFLAAREQSLLRDRARAQLRAQRDTAILTAEQLGVQIQELADDLAKAVINSPVQGQIFKLAEANALYMREGEEIARIRTDTGFEVEANIPADYLRFLSPADVIEAEIETASSIAIADNILIQLKLRSILPTQNSRTSTRPVRFIPVNGLPALAQAENTALNLRIPTSAPEKLITISQDALVPVNGGYVVFVANQGRAEQRIVTLGGVVQDRVVILDGVRAGESVITKGNEILSDGSEIATGGGRKGGGAKKGQKPGARPTGKPAKE